MARCERIGLRRRRRHPSLPGGRLFSTAVATAALLRRVVGIGCRRSRLSDVFGAVRAREAGEGWGYEPRCVKALHVVRKNLDAASQFLSCVLLR